MLLNKDKFISISYISKFTGLKYHAVRLIIERAYKVGYLKRIQSLKHENGFNKGLKVYKTAYQINYISSWQGLHDKYHLRLASEKGIYISFTDTLMRQPGTSIKDLIAWKKNNEHSL